MASFAALTLLIGGARSGKSSMAVELGRRHNGPVTVIATLVPDDDALVARVTRHRAERPDWPTIEAPHDLVGALGRAEGLAIVDCLTLWVSNLMLRGDDDEAIDNAAVLAADAAASGASRRSSSATRSASACTPRPSSACATETSSAA